MWFAIAVTVAAATGNNIGKALQKEAVHSLPRFSLHPGVFRQYLRSRLWLIGLAADLGGALLMIAAFALAPVSLVQPVSGLGLVSLAIFSHFHLKERLAAEEWGAVAMSMLGTIGLGVSTSDEAPAESQTSFGAVRTTLTAAFLLALVTGLLYASRYTSMQRRKSPADAKAAASVHGIQAGACFGLSAASCKAGILLVRPLGWIAFLLGLGCSVLLSSLGFMLQTLGLKDGNTVVVCTCAAVSSMGTGVVIGLVAMGEPLPSELSMKLLRMLSWLVTMAGVSALANGRGGLQEVARISVGLLPRRVKAYLPAGVTPRKLSEKGMKLPTTEDESSV